MSWGQIRGRVKTQALEPLRRGKRTVLWAPDWMGMGNHMYLWLWADVGIRAGHDRRVLQQPSMANGLTFFPEIREHLSVDRRHVRLWDRRTMLAGEYGDFGDSFTADQLSTFIRERLASPLLDSIRARVGDADPAAAVLNVRRGDYYSNADFREMFSYDAVAYARAAVTRSIETLGPISTLKVVSDGPDWCRSTLGWLADHVDRLEFSRTDDDASTNFRDVASSRRIIVSNSTFSYWAAYVSNAVHDEVSEGNRAAVVAPWFFNREDGVPVPAHHLDPQWQVVREIDGGWAPA